MELSHPATTRASLKYKQQNLVQTLFVSNFIIEGVNKTLNWTSEYWQISLWIVTGENKEKIEKL